MVKRFASKAKHFSEGTIEGAGTSGFSGPLNKLMRLKALRGEKRRVRKNTRAARNADSVLHASSDSAQRSCEKTAQTYIQSSRVIPRPLFYPGFPAHLARRWRNSRDELNHSFRRAPTGVAVSPADRHPQRRRFLPLVDVAARAKPSSRWTRHIKHTEKRARKNDPPWSQIQDKQND